jgi:hypothetical protein
MSHDGSWLFASHFGTLDLTSRLRQNSIPDDQTGSSITGTMRLDRLQWAVTPWPARVIVCIVEGLLWPFKMLGWLRE